MATHTSDDTLSRKPDANVVELIALIAALVEHDDAEPGEGIAEQIRRHALEDLELAAAALATCEAVSRDQVARVIERALRWLKLAPEIGRRFFSATNGEAES